MQLSETDRELLLEELKQQAAAGTIDLQELEHRVEVVAAASSREEALAAVADLPPLGAPGSSRPARRRLWFGRGHGHADAPQPDWQPTRERFRDPRTGAVMRVWVDRSGGRHYVVDD